MAISKEYLEKAAIIAGKVAYIAGKRAEMISADLETLEPGGLTFPPKQEEKFLNDHDPYLRVKVRVIRNRDITVECKCLDPEGLKKLFDMAQWTEEDRKQQELYETVKAALEEQIWEQIILVPQPLRTDLNGDIIKRDTHEIGFKIVVTDGLAMPEDVWVRPKKSEYMNNK